VNGFTRFGAGSLEIGGAGSTRNSRLPVAARSLAWQPPSGHMQIGRRCWRALILRIEMKSAAPISASYSGGFVAGKHAVIGPFGERVNSLLHGRSDAQFDNAASRLGVQAAAQGVQKTVERGGGTHAFTIPRSLRARDVLESSLGMPELSRFFGIVVRMYFNDHHPAHFHACYGDSEALIEIETLNILRGELPRRALAMVLEWAVLHRQELRMAWMNARGGKPASPSSRWDRMKAA